MKKSVLTILFFATVLATTTFGQNSSLILGVNGGSSFYKQSYTGDYVSLTTSDESSKRTIKFNGGIDLGFRYSNFSFLTGVKYIQRGTKNEIERRDPNDPIYFSDGTTDLGTIKSKTTMSSISIPLTLRYEFPMEAVSFSIALGPIINRGIGTVNTTKKYDLEKNTFRANETKDKYGVSATEIFKPNFTSFMFSTAVHFNIGESGKLSLSMVYETSGNLGNENVLVQVGQNQIDNVMGSIKSSGIGITIGYEHRIDLTMGSKY